MSESLTAGMSFMRESYFNIVLDYISKSTKAPKQKTITYSKVGGHEHNERQKRQ